MPNRHALRAAALFLVASAAPALAQEPFLSGVYLGSQKLCDQAKSKSLQSVLDAGEYVLTAQGVKGSDEDCQFLRTDKARGADAWIVSTLCIRQDGNYPDLYSVTKLSDGRISVSSVYDGNAGEAEADEDVSGEGADDSAAQDVAPQSNDADGQDSASADQPAVTDDNGVEPGYYVSCPGVAAP